MRLLCVVWWAVIFCACAAQEPRSDNTNCRAWQPNTQQDVVVDGMLHLGAECNVVLQNLSVTFFCYPNSTIRINRWRTVSGYVAIVGPPEEPWNVSDVAVIVSSSTIEAVGPAVAVRLGYEWPGPAFAAHFAAMNVSLTAVDSTLRSSSIHSASVLSCTCFDVPSSIAVIASSFSARGCTLAATGGAVAAVVGVAVPRAGDVLIVNSSFNLSSSSTWAETLHESMCTAAVASGVAVAYASNVLVDNCTAAVSSSKATSSSTGRYSASAVGGVAVANAIHNVSVSCGCQSVNHSNALSRCDATDDFSASSVGGVAISSANIATVSNCNQSLRASNVTVTSTTGGSSAATAGGVAVASANVTALANITQIVAESSSVSSADSARSGASSIGGVSVASVNFAAVDNCAQNVSRSTATSSSSCPSRYSASAVGGVAVASANRNVNVLNCRCGVVASNATSGDVCGDGRSASCVGGSSVPVPLAGSTFHGTRMSRCRHQVETLPHSIAGDDPSLETRGGGLLFWNWF